MSAPRSKRFKTIKLRDVNGNPFYLQKTQAVDAAFKASRLFIFHAIAEARREGSATLFTFSKTAKTGPYAVGVHEAGGKLRLGCHLFSPFASKKIIAWAKAGA